MVKSDVKINAWEPFESQLHQYYLPASIRLDNETFPETWKFQLPRDSTYHKVKPIDVGITVDGVKFSSKKETIVLPIDQISNVSVDVAQKEMMTQTMAIPFASVYFIATITFTKTDGKKFKISLPDFTFIPALAGLLNRLGITYLDPTGLGDHLDDLSNYLKTLF